MGITTQVLRTIPELQRLRHVWEEWQRHPNSDFDFYCTVLSSTPAILRPHVIVLYRDGTPDAMLVGRVETRRMEFRIGYGNLLRPQARTLTVVHGGLLGNSSAGNCALFVKEILVALRQGEADIAFFNEVQESSTLHRAAKRLPGMFARCYSAARHTHRSMQVPAGVEALYQGLSSKTRKNQRWQAKKLVQDHAGKVEVRCLRHECELDDAIRQVEQIVEKTYHRALGIGFSDSPDMRERLSLQAQKGWLRIYLLLVEDQPWAFWIGRMYQHTFHSDFMGYDPANAKYSPGMFLIMKVIEGFSCGADGESAKEIDFGFGDAQYKQVLGNCEWQESSVHIFAPNLKGLRLHVLQMPSVLVDRLVRPLLERTNLAKRIKKLWRTWATEREIHIPSPKAAGAGVGRE